MTVYVSVGNSDDKLSQSDWISFVNRVEMAIEVMAPRIYGRWYSSPLSPYQNACICFDIESRSVEHLQYDLALLAAAYRQDSVAWAETPETLLIEAIDERA